MERFLALERAVQTGILCPRPDMEFPVTELRALDHDHKYQPQQLARKISEGTGSFRSSLWRSLQRNGFSASKTKPDPWRSISVNWRLLSRLIEEELYSRKQSKDAGIFKYCSCSPCPNRFWQTPVSVAIYKHVMVARSQGMPVA